MRAPMRRAISKARRARTSWPANVCRAAKISCWKRGSTSGASGRTHFSRGEAMEMTRIPCASTMRLAWFSSSSVRSMMFLPNTILSSAATMPTSAMERTAVSRSGENSSVMAARGKYWGMHPLFYRMPQLGLYLWQAAGFPIEAQEHVLGFAGGHLAAVFGQPHFVAEHHHARAGGLHPGPDDDFLVEPGGV